MNTRTELSPSAERIADVAQALVQEVGYNGFSFEHISQAVGMRKASIHHHFASKVDLGVTVVKRYTQQFEESLRQVNKRFTSASERLMAYADLFEATFQKNQDLCACGMLGAESNSLDELLNIEVKRFFQINLNWLTGVIQDGLTQGALQSKHDASELSQALLSLLEGSMLVGRYASKPLGPRHACEIFLSGVTT